MSDKPANNQRAKDFQARKVLFGSTLVIVEFMENVADMADFGENNPTPVTRFGPFLNIDDAQSWIAAREEELGYNLPTPVFKMIYMPE